MIGSVNRKIEHLRLNLSRHNKMFNIGTISNCILMNKVRLIKVTRHIMPNAAALAK